MSKPSPSKVSEAPVCRRNFQLTGMKKDPDNGFVVFSGRRCHGDAVVGDHRACEASLRSIRWNVSPC